MESSACKICYEYKNVTLLSTKDALNTILEKIALCFHINLNSDMLLPLSICIKCVSELNSAYSFHNKCLTLHEKLKEICPIKANILNRNKSYDTFHENITKINIENLSEVKYPDRKFDLESKGVGKKVTFKCSVCNKMLKTELSLIKHNQSMHVNRKHLGKVTGTGINRRYHCTKCSYSTPHSQTLANHMRTHNGDRPYSCECGKTFTQSSSLAAHTKIHSSKTFYTCSVCGKQFKHAFSLKKHQFVHESGKFVCDICNKQLKSHQSLQDHIHRHYNVRNYSCEDCGNTFVTGSELHNHRKIHTEQNVVECHVCGYKTSTKKNLIIHLKRHTGEKSYKCVDCSLLFYTNGDLKRHQRVHTRQKPYTCPTCSQRFSHSPSLNKHMLSIHGTHYKWADIKFKESQLTLKSKNENGQEK